MSTFNVRGESAHLEKLLAGMKGCLEMDDLEQVVNLRGLYMTVRISAPSRDCYYELPWLQKRWKLFHALPRHDQLLYINHFTTWRQAEKRKASADYFQRFDDYDHLLYLLPNLSTFVRTIRTGHIDGNCSWEAWWGVEEKKYDAVHRYDEQYVAEKRLLNHLLEYEALGESVVHQFPDDTNVLPSISAILNVR
ncbi:hypothetical protein F4819DRAFT_489002 [Hypoxylon fuscum]|nr:hypothetical protein F4819DRAFT_489002 [Hypoxylon fuscum]